MLFIFNVMAWHAESFIYVRFWTYIAPVLISRSWELALNFNDAILNNGLDINLFQITLFAKVRLYKQFILRLEESFRLCRSSTFMKQFLLHS